MTEWLDLDDTARNGVTYRVWCDDGHARRGYFAPPHWWVFGEGAMRLADAGLYSGDDMIKVTHWKPWSE